MSSLGPLLRVQLLGAFGVGRLLNERDPKAKRKLALAAVGVALLAVGYAWMIGSSLATVGVADALPALAVAVSGVGCVFSTFVKANGLLFGFKDFDLVVTMPAPLWAVAVSRTAPLYGMGLVLSALMGGPLMAAYLLAVGAGPADIAGDPRRRLGGVLVRRRVGGVPHRVRLPRPRHRGRGGHGGDRRRRDGRDRRHGIRRCGRLADPRLGGKPD